jgi:hypothetical protein
LSDLLQKFDASAFGQNHAYCKLANCED